MKAWRIWPVGLLMMLVLLWSAATARAQADFLDPADAFVFDAQIVQPAALDVTFRIAPEYYLYRERFGVTTDPAGVLKWDVSTLPPGEVKYDPTFERDMAVFHDRLSTRIDLPDGGEAFTLVVAFQGCADAGLCYPPMTHALRMTPVREGWSVTGHAVDGGEMRPVPRSERQGMASLFSAGDLGLADAIGGLGLVRTALVFLGLGVLLALTPCVLPMVPILSALVLRDAAGKRPSRMRGVGLAAAYVAGMSVVYTALGVAAGLSGVGLAAALQKPWVLMLFASLLVVLALATFGAFTLQMPVAIQSRLSAAAARSPRGRVGGAALMGALSALIVGPCVAAPLAGALLYISQSGDVLLGGTALFALAWGMGVPLLVVGASSSAWLPSAGSWMQGVSRLFGMLLLATALYLLTPLMSVTVQMAAWGSVLLVGGVMLLAGSRMKAAASDTTAPPLSSAAVTLRFFGQGLALALLLAGAAQWIGALSAGRDLLNPLGHFARVDTVAPRASASQSGLAATMGSPTGVSTAQGWATALSGGDAQGNQSVADPGRVTASGVAGKPTFVRVRTLAELDAAVAASTRPVMLDFYADWCVSCHEMERFTFTDPGVAQRMAGMTLLQADVTANNADDRALLKQFRLFGPPGIIFFDRDGQVRDAPRVIGYQNARQFTQALDLALK